MDEELSEKLTKNKVLFDSIKINFISLVLLINAFLLTLVISIGFIYKGNIISTYFELLIDLIYNFSLMTTPFALIYIIIEKTEFKFKSNLKPNDIFIFAILFVISSMIIGGILINFLSDYDSRGTFGDMFGAVNTFFSGLGFAGLIYTIFLQLEDSKKQREEFQLQLDEQRNQFAKQRFDDKFFNLLNLLNEITKDLKIITMENSYLLEGRYVLSYIKNLTKKNYDNTIKKYLSENIINIPSGVYNRKEYKLDISNKNDKTILFKLVFNKIYMNFDPIIDHYVNNINHLLLIVSGEKNLSEDDKQFYINILKTQINPDESTFFAYYHIFYSKSQNNSSFFIDILEKYQFFDRIDYYSSLIDILNINYNHIREQWERNN